LYHEERNLVEQFQQIISSIFYTGVRKAGASFSNSIDEDLDIIGIILRRIYHDFDPLVKIFAPFFERK
jgi:hypothetical protein